MSREAVRTLCEMVGIQFAAKTYGLTTTRTITLDAIEQVVHKAIDLDRDTFIKNRKQSEVENPHIA